MEALMNEQLEQAREHLAQDLKDASADGVAVTVPDRPLVARCAYRASCQADGFLMLHRVALHIEGEESWLYICPEHEEEMAEEV